tara:strand:- start:14730 stop:15008 length:279 start_codon:yes stop_codon:yes gene_type:complete
MIRKILRQIFKVNRVKLEGYSEEEMRVALSGEGDSKPIKSILQIISEERERHLQTMLDPRLSDGDLKWSLGSYEAVNQVYDIIEELVVDPKS